MSQCALSLQLCLSHLLAAQLRTPQRSELLMSLQMPALTEGVPAVANIAHGNSSILADQIGLKLVGQDGFVVTEVRHIALLQYHCPSTVSAAKSPSQVIARCCIHPGCHS